jgi:hypothetical protein
LDSEFRQDLTHKIVSFFFKDRSARRREGVPSSLDPSAKPEKEGKDDSAILVKPFQVDMAGFTKTLSSFALLNVCC